MSFRVILCAAVVLAAPAISLAEPLNGLIVIAHTSFLQKVVLLALAVSMVAAVVVAGGKVASGRHLAGGSAFVSGLRVGGPVIGGLGAAYALMDSAIGIANTAGEPTLKLLAPGLAEAGMMV